MNGLAIREAAALGDWLTTWTAQVVTGTTATAGQSSNGLGTVTAGMGPLRGQGLSLPPQSGPR